MACPYFDAANLRCHALFEQQNGMKVSSNGKNIFDKDYDCGYASKRMLDREKKTFFDCEYFKIRQKHCEEIGKDDEIYLDL